MWGYYYNKYCTAAGAVRAQYPNLLEQDPVLHILVLQAEAAADALDKYMQTKDPNND